MPVSRRNLVQILIPSLASELMGYCLTQMGIAPGVSCTMMGGTYLVKPGGLSSAQTVGISWIDKFLHPPPPHPEKGLDFEGVDIPHLLDRP